MGISLNMLEDESVHLAGYVVKLLLYADDLILISKMAHGLKNHFKSSRALLPRGRDGGEHYQNQDLDFLFKEES